MQTPHSEFDGNELDWLAFRYVAGELNETEAAQFEECLAIDQSAREAVARNVELTGALVTILSQTADRPVPTVESSGSRVWNAKSVNQVARRSRWGLLTSVAALALLASGLLWQRTQRSNAISSNESLAKAEQLLALWSENGLPALQESGLTVTPSSIGTDEAPANDVRGEQLVADAAADDAALQLSTKVAAQEQNDFRPDNDSVPEWMLAGASLEFDVELQPPETGVR